MTSFRNTNSEGLFDRGQVVNYFSVTHLKSWCIFERGCSDYLLWVGSRQSWFWKQVWGQFNYDASAHFIFLKDLFNDLFLLLAASFLYFQGVGSPSLVGVHGLLPAEASLIVEHGRALGWPASVVAAHRLSSCGLWAPERGGSAVVAHGFTCLCGIFRDQGSNLCPLIDRWILNHWTTREALSAF